MRTLKIKTMERCFQLFFIWQIWIMFLTAITFISWEIESYLVMRILSDIMFWSIPLVLCVLLPLLTTIILLKTKKCQDTKNDDRNKLNSKRQIHSHKNILKLTTMISNVLHLQYCNYEEENTQNSTDTTQYEPEFSHLLEPVTYIVKRIISFIKRVININRGEPKL